jgi:hypothetical protein
MMNMQFSDIGIGAVLAPITNSPSPPVKKSSSDVTKKEAGTVDGSVQWVPDFMIRSKLQQQQRIDSDFPKLAIVLHKTNKIAKVAVEKTTVAAAAAAVTAKELDAKHNISSKTMAAASSASEKTKSGATLLWAKVASSIEKKKGVGKNVGASESTVPDPATNAPMMTATSTATE